MAQAHPWATGLGGSRQRSPGWLISLFTYRHLVFYELFMEITDLFGRMG